MPFNKFFQKLKKDKRGASVVVYTVFILTVLATIIGVMDIISKTYTIDEIQSIMDVSGESTLSTIIDKKRLKEEILATDKEDFIDSNTGESMLSNYDSLIKQKYRALINASLKSYPNISSYKVSRQRVYFENSDWGIGESNKARPQIILDTTLDVELNSSELFDLYTTVKKDYYSSKEDKDFTITYKGKTKDGKTELVIRSVTRLVYR